MIIDKNFIDGNILYAKDMNTIVDAINKLDEQIEPIEGKLQKVDDKFKWGSFN